MKTITIKDDGTKKTSEILNDCRKLFSVYSYLDGEELDEQFPPVETEYTYEMTQEPSDEFSNISANDLKEKYPDTHFMTLRERLLFEIEYFKETGKNLDVVNWTLCAGSRYVDGIVPSVYFGPDGDEVNVLGNRPDDAFDDLRARSAVSLDSPSFLPSEITIKDIQYNWSSDFGEFLSRKGVEDLIKKLFESIAPEEIILGEESTISTRNYAFGWNNCRKNILTRIKKIIE